MKHFHFMSIPAQEVACWCNGCIGFYRQVGAVIEPMSVDQICEFNRDWLYGP
jgi:hypothetical protein